MSDPNNISPLGNGRKERLSEDKLMAYLEGKLSPAQQHEVEEWLSGEGMESDALEGLHGSNPHETKHTINKLNLKLRAAILSKKYKRKPLKTDYITWIAIAIILLLAVLAYIVIRKSM